MTTRSMLPTTTAAVQRRVTVAAPPAAVFALLCDPTQHASLDGTDTVRGVVDAPTRLTLGSQFRMQMKGYKTLNRVVEFQPDALIAWRHRGRHIWRWQLEACDGGTTVTEIFDYSAKRGIGLVRMIGIPARADAALDKTLTRLQARFA